MDFSTRKIRQALQMLTKQDIDRFENYLESPYFVKKESQYALKALFELLLEYIVLAENYEIPNKKLAKVVSDDNALKLSKLEKLLFQLNNLLFQFLALESVLDSNIPRIKTAEVLRKREVKNFWEISMKKSRKVIATQNNNQFNQSLELLSLKFEEYTFQGLSPIEMTVNNYDDIISGFNEFYSINMLQIALSNIAFNKFYFPVAQQNQFIPLKIILESESANDNNPEKQLLILAYNLLSDQESGDLGRLEEIAAFMNNHAAKISHSTKVNISTIIKNYAIRIYNLLGDPSIGKFIFNFYKQNIENRLLFHQSKIQVSSIFNIAHCAINEKEFDWLEQFMLEIEDQILEVQFKAFAVALIRSKIFLAKKEFEAALQSLDYNVVLPYFKGMARTMEIMILFELKSPQLDHKMEAFKIYMHRTKNAKVNPHFQIGYNNFIRILRSINHPKTAFDLARIEKIRTKIKSTEFLAERIWLSEKIEGMADKLK